MRYGLFRGTRLAVPRDEDSRLSRPIAIYNTSLYIRNAVLRPTHTGEFGFNNLTVLGDHETVTFERNDPWADNEDSITTETWQRTRTSSIDGRIVSVFTPRWPATEMQEYLRRYQWGIDQPLLSWGSLVLPGTGTDTGAAFGQVATEGEEEERVPLLINMRPPGIPATPVTNINDTVQYSSNVVNMWIPGFGDSRVNGGDRHLDLAAVTNKFYEHFADEYEIIAVLSQTNQMTNYGGFHRPVRNDITGIGLSLFDDTATYGSAGVLRAVQFYPPGLWPLKSTVLHEIGHQWGEFSKVWEPLGGPTFRASTLDRKGHDPEVHTPLLTPGAAMYGAVLLADRRVGESAIIGPSAHGPSYVIERTMPLITYNPLTLYRMGHLSAAALPTYQVFSNQGQFDEASASAPEIGTAVDGDHFQVTAADIMVADGVRGGPTVTQLRVAVVYVSRSGLVSKPELDIVNDFAARFGTTEGVTSWNRYPSFFEATGGKAQMLTAINPKADPATTPSVGGSALPTATPITPSPNVMYAPVGREALVGMRLDSPVPGRIAVGQTVTVSGTMTLTDRTDYHGVCFNFVRYGAADPNEIFECGELSGDRFSVDVSLNAQQQGTYIVQNFVFWPDSGGQFPRTGYGTIVVDEGPQASE